MVNEFRTKNIDYNIDYSWKIISILYIYICLEQNKSSNEEILLRSPLLNFEGGSWGLTFKH